MPPYLIKSWSDLCAEQKHFNSTGAFRVPGDGYVYVIANDESTVLIDEVALSAVNHFATMMASGMSEKETGRIHLDASGGAVNAFAYYLYFGSLPPQTCAETTLELAELAHMYGHFDLVDVCADVLASLQNWCVGQVMAVAGTPNLILWLGEKHALTVLNACARYFLGTNHGVLLDNLAPHISPIVMFRMTSIARTEQLLPSNETLGSDESLASLLVKCVQFGEKSGLDATKAFLSSFGNIDWTSAATSFVVKGQSAACTYAAFSATTDTVATTILRRDMRRRHATTPPQCVRAIECTHNHDSCTNTNSKPRNVFPE